MSKAGGLTSEEQIVRLVIRLLREGGYRVRREVPNMGQCADIVATRGRWVTFVEAKRADWQRAFQQCRAHEQVADYICVALGIARLPTTLVAAANGRGYGLIHCDVAQQECTWALFPRHNSSIWVPQRVHWTKLLKAIDYVHD